MLTAKILKQHSYHKFCHRVSVVNEDLNGNQACSKVGGRGGQPPPQILANQLTLSRPGGTHYPDPLLPAPPDF